MMKTVYATILAATIAAAAMPARAEPIDMSTVTCAQLLTMKPDEITFVLTWVEGYLAGTQEELSMDPDILGKHVTDTVTYCGENQEMSVLNAAKESTPQ